MKMQELIEKVVEWADDKGLLTDVTPERIEKQTLKVIEEIGETAKAILTNNKDEIIDGLGDIAVTLIILSKMENIRDSEYKVICFDPNKKDYYCGTTIIELLGAFGYYATKCTDSNQMTRCFEPLYFIAEKYDVSLMQCLLHAYNIISKRTGKMVGDTFIKD